MNIIIPWLEHLKVLMPPKHISLVGAGNGKGVWAQWLVQQTQARVTLVEADTQQCATLQRTLELLGQQAQHCEVLNTVVAVQPGRASFLLASNQQESSLLDPLSLQSLWPNLHTKEVQELNAITLDTLFSDRSECVEAAMNEDHWLLIDCLPAGRLLRASSQLALVGVVIARVLLGEMRVMPDGTSLEEVAELLQQKGMVQIAVEATRHPGIGYALFVRDARAALHAQVQTHRSECQKLRLNGEEQAKLLQEFRAKTEQLAKAKLNAERKLQESVLQLQQFCKLRDEQAKLAHEHIAQIEQLTQAKADAEKHSQEYVQELEQAHKEHKAQAKLAMECLAQIEHLIQIKTPLERQALQKSEAQVMHLQEIQTQNFLEERIKKILATQIDVGNKTQLEALSKIVERRDSATQEALQKIVNASEVKLKQDLGRGFSNSLRQLEAFMNIQTFFSKGEFFSDFHGWPISPDIGAFLIEIIRLKNYDLIIEFGSGTSTGIFAKTVETIKEIKGNSTTEIFTFEHNQEYYNKTHKMLQARNLEGYVNLVYAPLIDYEINNINYNYYDCECILRKISDKYSSQKIKILVFIDGPPGATCKNARYPAVPLILKTFFQQSIDFVLDDSYRAEEKNVIKLWGELFEERGMDFLKKEIVSEKGIFYMSSD